MPTVVGLYESFAGAQEAVERLRAMNIPASDISLAVRSSTGDSTDVASADSDTSPGGILTGVVGGGVLGGLAGLLVGAGALVVPGLGPVLTAGPIGAALMGAGIGAAAGGLVGALVDAGVPEQEAALYQTGVERGGVLVTAIVPGEQVSAARELLNQTGARDLHRDSGMYANSDFRYGAPIMQQEALDMDDSAEPIRTASAPVVSGSMAERAFSKPLVSEQDDDIVKEDPDQMDTGTGIAAGAGAGFGYGAVGGPMGATARAAAIGSGEDSSGDLLQGQGLDRDDTLNRRDPDGPSELTEGSTPQRD